MVTREFIIVQELYSIFFLDLLSSLFRRLLKNKQLTGASLVSNIEE